MIYIPKGFAHGFQCLADDCELIYHHSDFYKPGFEAGINYNDPLVAVEWPLPLSNISDRDVNHPFLNHNFEGLNIK